MSETTANSRWVPGRRTPFSFGFPHSTPKCLSNRARSSFRAYTNFCSFAHKITISPEEKSSAKSATELRITKNEVHLITPKAKLIPKGTLPCCFKSRASPLPLEISHSSPVKNYLQSDKLNYDFPPHGLLTAKHTPGRVVGAGELIPVRFLNLYLVTVSSY